MRRVVTSAVIAVLAIFACTTITKGEIGFAENQADRIRLWNTDYYEVAFRKADGRLLYIIDKTTGQEVSPGNIYGPWVMKFGNGSWLDGVSFSPSNPSRRFSYSWDSEEGTLTLTYAATGTLACNVSILVRPTEGPEVDMTLTLNNMSAYEMELISFPVQLTFRDSQIDGVYVPYMEGMRLKPNFFDNYEFNSSYPGQMFADFAYTELTVGSFAVYCLQDPALPMKPSTWMILPDGSYAGGSQKYHHDYELAVFPGEQWVSPVTVLSIGSSIEEAMAAYWTRSEHDLMPTLEEKLGTPLLDKLAHAVLLKRDFLQGYWTFSAFKNFLSNLPADNLLHLVAFWPNGFDEYYPDYLPPNSSLGSLASLQDMVSYARSSGHMVMPYTNPTWWDDQSPTLGSLGANIAASDRNGSLIYEYYGSHGGYVVSPYSSDVIARQDQTRDEFTETVPCDFLFEDQVGARGPTYDGHPEAENAMYYNQGLVEVATRSSMWLPIMTEGGFDRLAWAESGFCNSHTIGWHWWPSSTYTTYPMAPLWAHENLYFSVHNLAGTTMTNNLASLSYHMSIGYSLSYDLASLDLSWLQIIDRFQKKLVAPLVGTEMTAFERPSNNGHTYTTFADGTVVTANLTTGSMAEGDHVVVANGFMAEKDGRVLGGVFSELYGETLSGSSPHYLVFDYQESQIEIHQPRGDDGEITILRPAGWVHEGRIRCSAVAEDGSVLSQPITVGTDSLTVDYEATVEGLAVDYFRIGYIVAGDADCDGDSDQDDVVALEACLDGPVYEAAAGCECADLDGDQDVDLADFAELQAAYVGS